MAAAIAAVCTPELKAAFPPVFPLPGVNTPVWKNILKGLSHVMIGELAFVALDPVGVRTEPQYLKVFVYKLKRMRWRYVINLMINQQS